VGFRCDAAQPIFEKNTRNQEIENGWMVAKTNEANLSRKKETPSGFEKEMELEDIYKFSADAVEGT